MLTSQDIMAFYPNADDIRRIVSLMRTYLSVPYPAGPIFEDLLPFLNMVEEEERTFLELETALKGGRATPNDILELKRKLNICFRYFESSYRVYLRGTYTEFPAELQHDMAFVGSIHGILHALNNVVRLTLSRLGYDWKGFVTFSNTLTYRTAEASIVVLPFLDRNGVEFVQDWSLISHEIGHIYFWKWHTAAAQKLTDLGQGGDFRQLRDEILADCFSLEQGYALDILHLCNDFERVRVRYQDPMEADFFRKAYDPRLLAALLYVCARRDVGLRAGMEEMANTQSKSRRLIIPFLESNRQRVVEVLSMTKGDHSGLSEADMERFLELEFLRGGRRALEHWYEWENAHGNDSNDVEREFIRLILKYAADASSPFAKVRLALGEEERSRVSDAIQGIVDGEIVDLTDCSPLFVIKSVIDSCNRNPESLDSEEYAHVRAALILSLCSMFPVG